MTIGADRKPVADVTSPTTSARRSTAPASRRPAPPPDVRPRLVRRGSTRDYTSVRDPHPDEPDHGSVRGAGHLRLGRRVQGHRASATSPTPSGRCSRPASDMTKTHTIGAYGQRHDARRHHGSARSTSPTTSSTSVPTVRTVTEKWDVIQQNNACNQCHDSAGGPRRRAAGRQALRALPLAADDRPRHGQHPRHEGLHPQDPPGKQPAERPGRHQYHIIGNNQSDNDFSTVVFPQDIRNCQNCHEGRDPDEQAVAVRRLVHEAGPRALRRLPRQHQLGDGCGPPGWSAGSTTRPARPATSPQGDTEWDAGIRTAHTVPYRSKQLKGLVADDPERDQPSAPARSPWSPSRSPRTTEKCSIRRTSATAPA